MDLPTRLAETEREGARCGQCAALCRGFLSLTHPLAAQPHHLRHDLTTLLACETD